MTDELFDKLEDMGAEVEDSIERFMGDEDFYEEMLIKFPLNENVPKMMKAKSEGDVKTAYEEVHSLKGVALNLGFLPLVDVCMDMLLDYRAGNFDDALKDVDPVEKCFYKWSDVVKEFYK